MTPQPSWTGKNPGGRWPRRKDLTDLNHRHRPAAATAPAALMSGGILPAPLLAAKIAGTATIVPIVHPGDAAPQPPLPPLRSVGDVHSVPGHDVSVPGLRRTRPPLRHRPHHRLSGRAHSGIQPEMSVPKTPLAQNLRWLARPTVARRHRGLGLTTRADLHHPPRQPNTVPHPLQTHRPHHPRRGTKHVRRPRTGHAPTQSNPKPDPHQSHRRRTPIQPNPHRNPSRRTK